MNPSRVTVVDQPRLSRSERRRLLPSLVDQGLPDKEIARRFGVHERTVLRDRQDLMLKSRRVAA